MYTSGEIFILCGRYPVRKINKCGSFIPISSTFREQRGLKIGPPGFTLRGFLPRTTKILARLLSPLASLYVTGSVVLCCILSTVFYRAMPWYYWQYQTWHLCSISQSRYHDCIEYVFSVPQSSTNSSFSQTKVQRRTCTYVDVRRHVLVYEKGDCVR